MALRGDSAMICPMYGMDCKCDAIKPLQCHAHVIASPPKPTMAEIERLVDAYGNAMLCTGGPTVNLATYDMRVARAALMAAIRQLSNSTQDGE